MEVLRSHPPSESKALLPPSLHVPTSRTSYNSAKNRKGKAQLKREEDAKKDRRSGIKDRMSRFLMEDDDDETDIASGLPSVSASSNSNNNNSNNSRRKGPQHDRQPRLPKRSVSSRLPSTSKPSSSAPLGRAKSSADANDANDAPTKRSPSKRSNTTNTDSRGRNPRIDNSSRNTVSTATDDDDDDDVSLSSTEFDYDEDSFALDELDDQELQEEIQHQSSHSHDTHEEQQERPRSSRRSNNRPRSTRSTSVNANTTNRRSRSAGTIQRPSRSSEKSSPQRKRPVRTASSSSGPARSRSLNAITRARSTRSQHQQSEPTGLAANLEKHQRIYEFRQNSRSRRMGGSVHSDGRIRRTASGEASVSSDGVVRRSTLGGGSSVHSEGRIRRLRRGASLQNSTLDVTKQQPKGISRRSDRGRPENGPLKAYFSSPHQRRHQSDESIASSTSMSVAERYGYDKLNPVSPTPSKEVDPQLEQWTQKRASRQDEILLAANREKWEREEQEEPEDSSELGNAGDRGPLSGRLGDTYDEDFKQKQPSTFKQLARAISKTAGVTRSAAKGSVNAVKDPKRAAKHIGTFTKDAAKGTVTVMKDPTKAAKKMAKTTVKVGKGGVHIAGGVTKGVAKGTLGVTTTVVKGGFKGTSKVVGGTAHGVAMVAKGTANLIIRRDHEDAVERYNNYDAKDLSSRQTGGTCLMDRVMKTYDESEDPTVASTVYDDEAATGSRPVGKRISGMLRMDSHRKMGKSRNSSISSNTNNEQASLTSPPASAKSKKKNAHRARGIPTSAVQSVLLPSASDFNRTKSWDL